MGQSPMTDGQTNPGDVQPVHALRNDAANCFTAPFDGLLTIICHGEKPFRPGTDTRDPTPFCTLAIDGHQTPPVVTIREHGQTDDAPQPGKLTWRVSREVLQRIFLGDRQLSGAFIAGRLLISGDMAVMARLRLSDRIDRTG